MKSFQPLLISACAFGLLLPVDSAHTLTRDGSGVTDAEIRIGQTMPYSGPVSAIGTLGRATGGQPSGRAAQKQQRPQPADRSVQQASEASFPASDAPAYTH